MTQAYTVSERIRAIEEWVCQVSDLHLGRSGGICKTDIRQAAQNEANEGFDLVESYTEDDLASAKEALNSEIVAEEELNASHDAEIADEVDRLIKERVNKHFSDYQKCWETIR